MKKFLLIALLALVPSMLFAQTYCQWSGTEGINCRNLPTDVNYIRIPPDNHPISIDAENLLQHGYYELIVTDPVLGENQILDQVVWGFDSNTITKTWTVRDLTATEIDQGVASPMPLSEYYLWKALYVKGVITLTDIQNNLPQELQDAYLARDRLENP